jgi:hypothetical protein
MPIPPRGVQVAMMVKTREGAIFGQALGYHVEVPLEFSFRRACKCGCGRPDRLDITLYEFTVSFNNAATVDQLIEVLQDGRRRLWGDPQS